MAAGMYAMQLIVPAKMLGTIIELLDGEGILVSVQPHEPTKSTHQRHRRNRRGNDGVSLVLDTLKAGPKTTLQLQEVFIKQGYAPATSQARLSEAVKMGKVSYDRSSRTAKLI